MVYRRNNIIAMARRGIPAHQRIFHYQSFQIDKSQPLGRGSYGAVYKAKCDQLPCAAKVLHPTIVDPDDPGVDTVLDKFHQECALLESIRHPNIVQYLSTTTDPESRLPVLLMELLDESLTKLLERSPQSLAYYLQVDICHDIALAIAYLHSNNIIHRDLSSNNVLIIAGKRAKVTDFGVSKLADAVQTMTSLTKAPGTLVYMSPEALWETPTYTKKLDCFSEGVILIQVCTRLWPEPGPRTEHIPDSRSPTGSIELPVLEPERRKNHIDLIDPNHPLLPIAMDCLKYHERERPSSEELCQRLGGLKDLDKYSDNLRHHQDEIQTKNHQISLQNRQLFEKDRTIQRKDSELQQQRTIYDQERRDMQRQNQEAIVSRERQLQQLSQQLEEQKQITAEFRKTNYSLQRQLEQSQQKKRYQDQVISPYKPNPTEEVKLSWCDGGTVMLKMERGDTATSGTVAYFMDWNGETCSYNSTSRKWNRLPNYPYQYSSLAIIFGRLTAIGGSRDWLKGHSYTNKLLSLNGSWSEVLPPMPTKRCGTTAVTLNEQVVVAGGTAGLHYADHIKTVEVMDTKSLPVLWSTVASLPHPYNLASATICGNYLYMLGGMDDKSKTKSVLTCSLTELLQSSSSTSSVWHRVADAPAYHSTCVSVNGQILAVGGRDKSGEARADIHMYDPPTNSWNPATKLPTARFCCLVAVLPNGEMMAVGGKTALCINTDKVEIANSFSMLVI